MRLSFAWLLMLPWAFGANAPTFTYTLSGSGVGAIATDAAGNTYIAGGANGGIVPTPGAFQSQNNSSGICQYVPMVGAGIPCYGSFIEKLDYGGNVIFATFFGGNGNTGISGIAVDQQGNIYVAGTTSPPVGKVNTFPVTQGVAFPTQPYAPDTAPGGFISKLDGSGSRLIYSTFFPATVNALAIDAAGNTYVTGYGSAPSFPATPGAFQMTPKSANNLSPGIVAKLNASGTAVVYATYVSGSGTMAGGDYPTSIAVDAAGDAFITGWTNSTDFPVTAGAFLTTWPGERSVFLTKLNPVGGGLVFSTYLGPTAYAPMVKLDGQGAAFVAGSTASTSFPTTAGAMPFTAGLSAVNSDSVTPVSGFLTHFSVDGSSLIYSTFVGAVGYASAALDVDRVGNAVIAGVTSDAALPVGAAAFQPTYAGGVSDAYIARFTPSGELSGATYLGGSLTDSASLIAFGPNGSVAVSGTTQSPGFPGIAQPVTSASVTFVTSIFPSLTVLNAASYIATQIAPGEIVALKGYGMGPVNGVIASGATLPTMLGGVSIAFDRIAAPLLYVQADQINAQVPWEIAGRTMTAVTATFPNQPQQPTTLVVAAPSLPGIFHVNNADGSPNSAANPAHPGDLISLYGTGGGSANPAGVTGQFWGLSAPLSTLTLPVSVSLNGENAAVSYAGSAPTLQSGIFQINALVPPDTAASATGTVVVTIGGVASAAAPIAIAIP